MGRQRDVHQTRSDLNFVGRRDFLKFSSLAVGWTALSTNVGIAVWASKEARAAALPDGINHMSAYEYQVLNRLKKVMLPTEGSPFPGTDKVPVMQVLDAALLGGMEPHILAGLKSGIKYFDAGPKEQHDNKHFSELSDDEAAQFCDAWADGDTAAKRGLVMGLKKLIGLAYWSNPATWPALDYGGPFSRKAGIIPAGNAPMPS